MHLDFQERINTLDDLNSLPGPRRSYMCCAYVNTIIPSLSSSIQSNFFFPLYLSLKLLSQQCVPFVYVCVCTFPPLSSPLLPSHYLWDAIDSRDHPSLLLLLQRTQKKTPYGRNDYLFPTLRVTYTMGRNKGGRGMS